LLRAPRADDAATITALINDIRIAQNLMRVPHPYALSDARGWLDAVAAKEIGRAFLITLADGTPIGVCGLDLRAGRTPEPVHWLGYWLGTHYWGQGYATEAARAVIDHAFGELGCAELNAGARVSNHASRRVLEKCGFQWTGVGLYRMRAINSSAPHDQFRLDRGIWSSLKSWGKAKRIA
jgi:RimJ/RimL family protein N-acetyltransferase